ncbi:MAG: alpha/beta hydrolase-fold protein [Cyclobacteriaceae bacterium]
MMKLFFVTTLLALMVTFTYAQESIFDTTEIVSPEIHEDGSVTFRLYAPEANTVQVSGDFLASQDGRPMATMQKDDKGLWSYTTDALSPELYSYNLMVDGVKTIDPSHAHTIRDVANVFNYFIIGGDDYTELYKVQQVPHGAVSYVWYTSPVVEKDRRMAVYTPPGYNNDDKDYPVFYLLHGMGGDEEAWLGLGRTAQIMDNLIAQGKAEPMIVVMTNGNVAQEAAAGMGSEGMVQPTFEHPNTMDGLFEESFADVMTYVESHYRVKDEKSNHAIAGLSMGGFHAANISRHYADRFDYIGLFSPALHIDLSGFPEAVAYQDADAKLRQQMQDGYELYWIAIGEKDFDVLLQGVDDYTAKMDGMGMGRSYESKKTEGGHTWVNWRRYLVDFTQRLFR